MRDKVWNRFGWVAAVVLLSVTLACGPGKPSYDKPPTEAEGVDLIRTAMAEKFAGSKRFVSGQKVNGEYYELRGQKRYKMQVECVVEYTQDCYLYKDALGGVNYDTVFTRSEAESLGSWYMSKSYVPVQAGQRFTLFFTPSWKWTDNGWVSGW